MTEDKSPELTGNFEDEYEEEGVEEFTNTEDRCACLILLDKSSSMSNGIIEAIDGLNAFKESVMEDTVAARRVEVGILTYGGNSDVKMAREFSGIADFSPPPRVLDGDNSIIEPDFRPEGMTPMGQAICTGISKVEERKNVYKKNGITYYRPWIINITDGSPNDGAENWKEAKRLVGKGIKEKAFVLFNFGTESANFSKLKELPGARTRGLKGNNFSSLFKWLSASMKIVSHSATDEEITPAKPENDDDFYAPITT